MREKEDIENLNGMASKSTNVIDCKDYVELTEPKSAGFGNKSKSINDINDTYSHNVVEYYGP